MIGIVDYGMGNIGSIYNMFKYIGAKAYVCKYPEDIKKASKIVLPGVGSFKKAMEIIKDRSIYEALEDKVIKEGSFMLGICLGMQLLTKYSEEGNVNGFGWVDAETLSFKNRIDASLKIPHMGWNIVKIHRKTPITEGFENWKEIRFYFVHSYFVRVKDEKFSMFRTYYGLEFDSGICKNNVYGVQFHPEKSHKYGMKLLENFAKL